MKSILYIINSLDENNNLGYRHTNITRVLSSYFKIDLLDFAFTKKRARFFRIVINRLFIFPDIYQLEQYKMKKRIRAKLINKRYDLVIIGVVPFSFLSLASFIKRVKPELEVLVDMTDPLTQNVTYIRYWKIYKRFLRWYEKRHFQNINRLIVLNEAIKLYYENLYPSLQKVIVLEQGTESQKHNDKKPVKNLDKVPELIYAGMFYHKLREPFKLYTSIEKFDTPVRLSIFGSFKKKFIPPNTERFYFGGLLDKSSLQNKINKFDILVFIDNFYGLQIPGKVLENLATNKPILFIYANENSPTLRYIQEYEGIFYARNNEAEIKMALENILKTKNNYFNRDLTKYYWENLVKESYYS